MTVLLNASAYMPEASAERYDQKFEDILYRSEAMARVCQAIRETAQSDITILVQGESGTGKELVAQAIHRTGLRRKKPFFAQNAAALPDTLLESELFGHRRGSFSGAVENKIGFFEQANGGTVFLDEIGEASMAFQVRLLRLLEKGTFRRVGDTTDRKTDVRIIAATNRDLLQEVAHGRFRQDLYYRLCVFPIYTPSLRSRPEDIPLLADFFTRKYNKLLEKPHAPLPRSLMEELCKREWLGNVRELKNFIHRTVILSSRSSGTTWSPDSQSEAFSPKTPDQPKIEPLIPMLRTLAEVERDHINSVLRIVGGNQTRAARHLGLKRSTFRSRLKKLGVTVNRRPVEANA